MRIEYTSKTTRIQGNSAARQVVRFSTVFLCVSGSLRENAYWIKDDEFVKSHPPVLVIPAKAGIQGNHPAPGLDSRVRGSDGFGDFFRYHHR